MAKTCALEANNDSVQSPTGHDYKDLDMASESMLQSTMQDVNADLGLGSQIEGGS